MTLTVRPEDGELDILAGPQVRNLHLEAGTGFRCRLGPLNLAEAVVQVTPQSGTLEVRVIAVRGKVGPVSIKLPASKWQPVVRKTFAGILPTLPAWLHAGLLPDGAWFGVEGVSLADVVVTEDELRLSLA